MQFWELVLKIVVAGFLLSLLGSLLAWAMVYVEARRGEAHPDDQRR